jgi:hypothetical protein
LTHYSQTSGKWEGSWRITAKWNVSPKFVEAAGRGALLAIMSRFTKSGRAVILGS